MNKSPVTLRSTSSTQPSPTIHQQKLSADPTPRPHGRCILCQKKQLSFYVTTMRIKTSNPDARWSCSQVEPMVKPIFEILWTYGPPWFCESQSDPLSCSGLILALNRSWATTVDIWGGICRNLQLSRPNLEMRCLLACFAVCARNRKVLLAAVSISFWLQRARILYSQISLVAFRGVKAPRKVFSGRSLMSVF